MGGLLVEVLILSVEYFLEILNVFLPGNRLSWMSTGEDVSSGAPRHVFEIMVDPLGIVVVHHRGQFLVVLRESFLVKEEFKIVAESHFHRVVQDIKENHDTFLVVPFVD